MTRMMPGGGARNHTSVLQTENTPIVIRITWGGKEASSVLAGVTHISGSCGTRPANCFRPGQALRGANCELLAEEMSEGMQGLNGRIQENKGRTKALGEWGRAFAGESPAGHPGDAGASKPVLGGLQAKWCVNQRPSEPNAMRAKGWTPVKLRAPQIFGKIRLVCGDAGRVPGRRAHRSPRGAAGAARGSQRGIR